MGQAVYSRQGQYEWIEKGNISTQGTILTTDKSAATVHALTSTTFVVLPIINGTIAINLRWRGGTEGHENIQVLYAMRGNDDHYTRIATLKLTTGTQTDGTHLFVDEIGVSTERWADDITETSDGADGIANLSFNTHGYTSFVLLSTTYVSTLYVDMVRE